MWLGSLIRLSMDAWGLPVTGTEWLVCCLAHFWGGRGGYYRLLSANIKW